MANTRSRKFIRDEIERAKPWERCDSVAFFSGSNKKDREWHVLAAVVNLLRSARKDAPTLADESERPDFQTYKDNGELWAPVEILEILPPGYRRHKEYKERANLKFRASWQVFGSPLADPWQTLKEQIIRKATKGYPSRTALFVYYDIGRFSFRDKHTPFDEQILTTHSKHPFDGVTTFHRVLVVNSESNCLVELHPLAHVIVKEP